jgi:dihydrofolate reductase
MNAIAVVDENWGIGYDGKLLVHLPGDLKYFKEKTLGNTIIIGRETFDSMGGKLLPNRETIILSRNPDLKLNCPVLRSLDETLKYIEDRRSEEVFVSGGETVYKLFLPYCDKFYITKIHKAFKADRHFPNLDERPDEFIINWSSNIMEENSVKYQFIEYIRKLDERI